MYEQGVQRTDMEYDHRKDLGGRHCTTLEVDTIWLAHKYIVRTRSKDCSIDWKDCRTTVQWCFITSLCLPYGVRQPPSLQVISYSELLLVDGRTVSISI